MRASKICSLIGLLLGLLWANSAHADFTWDFVETSLSFYFGGGPVPWFVPGDVTASLTISQEAFLRGTVSYSVKRGANGCLVTGDTDFLFSAPHAGASLPVPGPITFCDGFSASLNISIDKDKELTGEITDFSGIFDAQLTMDIANNLVDPNSLGNRVGSDFGGWGCTPGLCRFGGYWVRVVPEPSSIAVFGVGLGLLMLGGLGRIRTWSNRTEC